MHEIRSKSRCHSCRQPIPKLPLDQDSDLFHFLNEQIPSLNDRWMRLNIEDLCETFEEELNRWRADSHQAIDRFFQRKCRELHQIVGEKLEQQRQAMDRLQLQINESMNTEKLESLALAVQTLKHELTQIEKNEYFRIKTHSLFIDKNCIQITQLETYRFDLGALPLSSRFLAHTENSWKPIASNGQYLLKHQAPNLCLLNRQLDVMKQISWTHGLIWDMCWSAKLVRFILLTVNHVFLLDPNTMTIELMHVTKGRHWYSCACSDTSVYLSTAQAGSSISEFKLTTDMTLTKHWVSPNTCKKDEWIHQLSYGNGTLALLIGEKSRERRKRMELRSCPTLERLWSLRLDIVDLQNRSIRCCFLLDDAGWLVLDSIYSRLIHISKDGHVQTTIDYADEPSRGCLFGSNMLAIASISGLRLHQLFELTP